MPHLVAVACPRCGSEAMFEFAELVRIERKEDVSYFQNSDVFEYRFVESAGSGRWHAAIYYHGLKSSSTSNIRNLPEGYQPEDWRHGPNLCRSHGSDIGTLVCGACFLRRKHELDWPKEAFFQLEYKQHVLWAFNRETVVELIEFIKSQGRREEEQKWSRFLRHVPSHFLQSGAREPVLKKLNRLLAEG